MPFAIKGLSLGAFHIITWNTGHHHGLTNKFHCLIVSYYAQFWLIDSANMINTSSRVSFIIYCRDVTCKLLRHLQKLSGLNNLLLITGELQFLRHETDE